MNKEKVLDYVMNSPGNSNRAVLSGMLDGADGGATLPAVSGEDEGKVLTVVNGEWNKAESNTGYGCKEDYTTVFENDAFELSDIGYGMVGSPLPDEITANTIKVTLNGTEYTISKKANGGYGAYDDSGFPPQLDGSYPFGIGAWGGSTQIATFFAETVGTYSVKIEELGEITNITPCFVKAVKKATSVDIITIQFDITTNSGSSSVVKQVGSSYSGQELLNILADGSKIINVILTETIDGTRTTPMPLNIVPSIDGYGNVIGFGVFIACLRRLSEGGHHYSVCELTIPTNDTIGTVYKASIE